MDSIKAIGKEATIELLTLYIVTRLKGIIPIHYIRFKFVKGIAGAVSRPLCYYLIARKPKVLAATNHYNKIIGRYSLFHTL